MFTQFFGNFLLEKDLVTSQQLLHAIKEQNSVNLKLGVLAINAGYMTAKQVDKVHKMQMKIDKQFGNIAIEMGCMTDEQVLELLNSQKTGYLLLGQVLVDRGYITNSEFEKAIEEYKSKNKISNIDFTNLQSENMLKIIENFYNLDGLDDAVLYTEYISLLFKNIVRFIGDDFTPLKSSPIEQVKCRRLLYQTIEGEFNLFISIEAKDDVFVKFASRFSQEVYTIYDEYVKDSISEFLNLNNGIFCVNMSNNKRIELEITPQNIVNDVKLSLMKNAFCIPVEFTFGIINFIISGNMPTISK